MGLVKPVAPITLGALVAVTVVTVLTACGAVSVNVALVPVTAAFVIPVMFIAPRNCNTTGVNSATCGPWVEVVVITVLTVSE
jgi:hypothetical protein